MASYAQVAARNSEQTAEEASAPAPQTIIPNESLGSDSASYSTGSASDDMASSSSSGPSGVHVIDRSQLSELDTSDQQVVGESGPSFSEAPHITYETKNETRSDEGVNGEIKNVKEKLTGKKKLSAKDKEVAMYSGVGTLNVLALAGIGFWGWKRYTGGENGWKVLGIVAGVWVGFSSLEWLSVRAISTWKQKEKSS